MNAQKRVKRVQALMRDVKAQVEALEAEVEEAEKVWRKAVAFGDPKRANACHRAWGQASRALNEAKDAVKSWRDVRSDQN